MRRNFLGMTCKQYVISRIRELLSIFKARFISLKFTSCLPDVETQIRGSLVKPKAGSFARVRSQIFSPEKKLQYVME
jgi:hypothetical protein